MFRLTSPTAVVCTSVLFSAKHQIARGQKLLPGYSITSLQARLLSAGWSYFNTPTLPMAAAMPSTDWSLKGSLLFQCYEASNFWTRPRPFYFCSNTKQSLPEHTSLLYTLQTVVADSQSPLWGWKLVKHPALPFQLSPKLCHPPPQQLSLPQPFILVSVPPPSSC